MLTYSIITRMAPTIASDHGRNRFAIEGERLRLSTNGRQPGLLRCKDERKLFSPCWRHVKIQRDYPLEVLTMNDLESIAVQWSSAELWTTWRKHWRDQFFRRIDSSEQLSCVISNILASNMKQVLPIVCLSIMFRMRDAHQVRDKPRRWKFEHRRDRGNTKDQS